MSDGLEAEKKRLDPMAAPQDGAAESVAPEPTVRPSLLSARWRAASSSLLFVAAAAALYYELISAGGLKQSSALFIGMPLLIGLLVANLTRAGSIYGRTLQATVIVLALVAPLLGEGSICIYMAAPLFIGVAMLGALAVEVLRQVRGRREAPPGPLLCLALLPILLGLVERQLPPQVESVVTQVTLAGELVDWQERVRHTAPLAPLDSRFLALGFPLPQTFEDLGSEIDVEFAAGDRSLGQWRARRHATDTGARYQVLSDNTPIAEWMQMLDTEVEVLPAGPGQVELRLTTRFVPLLSPAWYFVPAERYAVTLMQQAAVDAWDRSIELGLSSAPTRPR